jgi:hypothetical protein
MDRAAIEQRISLLAIERDAHFRRAEAEHEAAGACLGAGQVLQEWLDDLAREGERETA